MRTSHAPAERLHEFVVLFGLYLGGEVGPAEDFGRLALEAQLDGVTLLLGVLEADALLEDGHALALALRIAGVRGASVPLGGEFGRQPLLQPSRGPYRGGA